MLWLFYTKGIFKLTILCSSIKGGCGAVRAVRTGSEEPPEINRRGSPHHSGPARLHQQHSGTPGSNTPPWGQKAHTYSSITPICEYIIPKLWIFVYWYHRFFVTFSKRCCNLAAGIGLSAKNGINGLGHWCWAIKSGFTLSTAGPSKCREILFSMESALVLCCVETRKDLP